MSALFAFERIADVLALFRDTRDTRDKRRVGLSASLLSLVSLVSLLSLSPAASLADCDQAFPKTPAEHLTVAECFVRNQEWKEAEEHFRFARQSSDLLEPATVGRAKALYHLNQPFDAMLELEDFLRTRPDSVPALQLFATLHSLVREDNRQAIAMMERCSQLAPNDSGVWQYLGNLYLARGRDEEAVRCFERAVGLTPQDAQALAYLGYACVKLGKAQEARAQFGRALAVIARASDPEIVWLTYGKSLQEERRWGESRAAYNEALKINPRSSEAHFGRALANENLKDFANAESDALRAISEYPVPRKDAYLLLIRVARAQKDQAKVESYAREMARVEAHEAKRKEDSRILSDLLVKAEPLFLQGRYVEAATAYQELLSRAPQFYEAYFALGMCYAHTAELPKAEEAFRKYLALQPLSADGHASLGFVLLQANRIGEARHELGQALEIDPGMLEVREAVAKITDVETEINSAQELMQAGEFKKALELLTPMLQGAQQAPPEIFMLMATCRLNLKEAAKALEVFEQGMSLYPGEQVLEEFYVKLLTNYVPIEQMNKKLETALLRSPASVVLLRAAAFLQVRLAPRSDEARRAIDRLIEVAPDNPNSHYIYGQWALLNHQEELAISEWEKTLTLAKVDTRMQMDVYTLIGDAENRLNRADRAEAAFKKAFQANAGLEKPNPSSALFYAEFLLRQSRFDESQAIIDQILRWAPKYGPALLQRARHLARVNKPEQAVVAGEEALSGTDLNPEQSRAAHVLLAKTYHLLKRTADAERHQQWLKSQ